MWNFPLHTRHIYIFILVQKKTRIKLYNTLALPVLLYGSKTWTIRARDARRISAAEMKYMRRTAGYVWTDYKTNAQIAKELKVTPILDKLLEYKRNWIQHVNRMSRNRLPRVMKRYSPNWQKESWQTFEETSGYMRLERVNKWPNSMTDI
jgi:hypothetical protein